MDPVEVFPIAPASAKALWLIAAIGLVVAMVVLALAYSAYSSRYARFEIDSHELRLVGDFWARRVPLETLDIDGARILDVHKGSEYAPKIRTFGTGLPGYASGWFRLRNGEKALAYLTRKDQVVYIPTASGYSIMLSARDPHALVAALKRRR